MHFSYQFIVFNHVIDSLIWRQRGVVVFCPRENLLCCTCGRGPYKKNLILLWLAVARTANQRRSLTGSATKCKKMSGISSVDSEAGNTETVYLQKCPQLLKYTPGSCRSRTAVRKRKSSGWRRRPRSRNTLDFSVMNKDIWVWWSTSWRTAA